MQKLAGFTRFFTLILVFAATIAASPQPAAGQSLLQQLVTPPDQQEELAAESAATAVLTPEQTRLIADLLRDRDAREALIAQLERLAAERAATAPAEGAAPVAPGAPPAVADPAHGVAAEAAAAEPASESFGRLIAQQTQAVAQQMATRALSFWDQLVDAPSVLSGLARLEGDFLLDALIELATVIATTVGLFIVLRMLAKRLYRWMGRRAKPMGFMGTALIYLGSVVVDALVVVLAWAAGYVLALTLFNDFGSIAIRQTMYLNAFLAVELVKVVLRAILSPSVSELRPVHVPDAGAKRSYSVLNVVTSIIGYGQLLVVPIVAQNVGYYSGRSVSVLLLMVALLILAVAVLRNRRAVADWLCNGRGSEPPGRLWHAVTRLWHVPVLLYLAVVFVIVVTQPGDVLLPVLWASARVVLAGIGGWLLAGMLGRAMKRGIRMPASVNRRLPLLERRLNTFVPRALFVIRFLILFAVIGYTLSVIGLFDGRGWMETGLGAWITGTLVSVALLLLMAFAVWLALSSWVDYRLNPSFGSIPTARESTLLTLLKNAVTVALVAITSMFVLSEIGVDIAPLIASAGIVGLAIGFGAQKMVQDIITGVFIQLENAINVGDVVTAGGTTGVVERLTIRSVSLRDFSGIYHIIPFSSVDTVSNFMREFAYSVVDMGVAYRVDVEVAKQAMFDAFEELRDDPVIGPSILDDLQWFGVDKFADSAVILRARVKTLPGQQWTVGRAYNGLLKRVFDERGIEIPFPHQTLYWGEGTQGKEPLPLRADLAPAGTVAAASTAAAEPDQGALADGDSPAAALSPDGGVPHPDDVDAPRQ